MASNVLPPASWARYCTFSDLLMHICTYHKKRDSAHIHKTLSECLKENFRELEGLPFYHIHFIPGTCAKDGQKNG